MSTARTTSDIGMLALLSLLVERITSWRWSAT
jgi:hypothetical protein